jgi:ABC-type antimicrobial peptide transport system permease subunit
MRVLVVLLSAGLTWFGLVIGLAVGVAFGTLASLSTFFIAFHQPEVRRALIETAEQSAAHFISQPKCATTTEE